MDANPYVPSDVIPPPCFAGRKEILHRAAQLMADARRGIHGGLLLSGHRGIGKTSVLRAVEATLPKDVAIVRVRFTRKAKVADFAAELVGRIRGEMPGWRRRYDLREVELPFISVKMAPRGANEASPETALFEAFCALRKVPVLWISLDDTDWVEGEALSLLKSAMEESVTPPAVVCIAGGPQIRRRLLSEHSPIIRLFSGSDFDLGNFTLPETREALVLPLLKGKTRAHWTEGAVARVHEWTGGYPYLVQCLAFAAFREGLIDEERVEAAVTQAMRIAGTWMEMELRSASIADLTLLDRLGQSHKAEWRADELRAAGAHPVYIARLEKMGALRKVSRGQYVLTKAPMIARFHLWKRAVVPEGQEGGPKLNSPNP